MPARDRHAGQAEFNRRFAERLPAIPGWGVTVLFYAALHYVEAFFAVDPTPGEERHYYSHADRDPAVERRLPEIAQAYLNLETASKTARYDCVPITVQEMEIARTTMFEPIQRRIEELLAEIDAQKSDPAS